MAAVTSRKNRELQTNKGVSRITKIIITYFRRGKAFICKRKGPWRRQNTPGLRIGVFESQTLEAYATDREESVASFLNSQKTTGS